MAQLRLYHYPLSPFSRKVRMALAEKGLEYERVFVNLARHEQYGAEYLALNPHGKVPLLVDDQVTVHESAAIIEYLEERYPDPPLLPSSLKARARVRALHAVADARLARVLGPLLLDQLVCEPTPEQIERIAWAQDSLSFHLDWLDTELHGRDWLVETFSVADIAFGSVFGTLLGYWALPDGFAGVRAWLGRLEARPTWRFAASVPMKTRRKELLRPLQCEGCGLPPFDRP